VLIASAAWWAQGTAAVSAATATDANPQTRGFAELGSLLIFDFE
jgi:hypothetical protein